MARVYKSSRVWYDNAALKFYVYFRFLILIELEFVFVPYRARTIMFHCIEEDHQLFTQIAAAETACNRNEILEYSY